mmetsp:Transcript_122579/g.346611  ORF Transcript_122579/g.346611 Transcript_122579/m.346611 type:complete len:277 (-) Transcript_122579:938-1768(-)
MSRRRCRQGQQLCKAGNDRRRSWTTRCGSPKNAAVAPQRPGESSGAWAAAQAVAKPAATAWAPACSTTPGRSDAFSSSAWRRVASLHVARRVRCAAARRGRCPCCCIVPAPAAVAPSRVPLRPCSPRMAPSASLRPEAWPPCLRRRAARTQARRCFAAHHKQPSAASAQGSRATPPAAAWPLGALGHAVPAREVPQGPAPPSPPRGRAAPRAVPELRPPASSAPVVVPRGCLGPGALRAKRLGGHHHRATAATTAAQGSNVPRALAGNCRWQWRGN